MLHIYPREWEPHGSGVLETVPNFPSHMCNCHITTSAHLTIKSMALGVLEDNVLPHVPGTVHIEEKQQQDVSQVRVARNLKHGTGREANIVLAPQPSDDPNDPLNWSYARKVIIVAILMFGAFIMPSTFGPLLSAPTAIIAAEFQVSITDVTVLSGYQLLVAGAWGPFVSA